MDIDHQIKNSLSYDAESGILFWKCRVARNVFAGSPAGSFDSKGYVKIVFRRKFYRAHRVAWFLYHGNWPEYDIDHVDLDPANNRIVNLRMASPSQNQANTRARFRKTKGITWHAKSRKWQSQIKVNGRNIYLGVFSTEAAAAMAYAEAAKEHFGNFARTA